MSCRRRRSVVKWRLIRIIRRQLINPKEHQSWPSLMLHHLIADHQKSCTSGSSPRSFIAPTPSAITTLFTPPSSTATRWLAGTSCPRMLTSGNTTIKPCWRRSFAVLALPGWMESKGVKMEMDYARALALPVNMIGDDHPWLLTEFEAS